VATEKISIDDFSTHEPSFFDDFFILFYRKAEMLSSGLAALCALVPMSPMILFVQLYCGCNPDDGFCPSSP
jgi:hypothetical protein